MVWVMKRNADVGRNHFKGLDLSRIQAVLFDLDGTLVDVDMSVFIPAYLKGLAAHFNDPGHRQQIAGVMRAAVIDMLSRVDGSRTLEQRLLDLLDSRLKIPARRYRSALDDFCNGDLAGLSHLVQGHPLAVSLLEACRANEWQVVLATNPIFPRAVIDARVNWGGLDGDFFDYVTSYETSRHCKPHLEYFQEILTVLDVPAESCLMIGNDTLHDMAAGSVGLTTCLLTPWRIDHERGCPPVDWQGTHDELLCQMQTSDGRPLISGSYEGLPASSAD